MATEIPENIVVPDDAIADLLAGDDEPEVVDNKEVKEPKDDKEEVINLDDEDDDKETKETKKDGEGEEELDIQSPPRKKQILKKYPDIFKDFPYLEKIIYRDREIAETFGSFDNLKEAAVKAETLDELETHVNSGSTVEFFSKVKENDPETFNKVVKNLLPNLQKVDKQAYVGVITDVMKRVLFEAHGQGKKANNEDLISAVETLVGWAFPSGITRDEPEESRVDPELERERNEFNEERLNTAVEEVQTKIENVLKATVEQYIDPKGDMKGYEKRAAIEDVLKRVDRDLRANVAFRKDIKKLWEEAGKGKYSQNHKDKIKSKYIGSAKSLLKKYILEVRREALKDSQGSRRTNKDDQEETTSTRRTISTGRSTPRTGGNDRLKMRPGESAAEFLARD